MGYILPVNSIQSQQYANRMQNNIDFITIQRSQPVELNVDFQNAFEESADAQQADKKQITEKSTSAFSNSQTHMKGYIHPNPANLSPAISQVVGKGIAINAYV